MRENAFRCLQRNEWLSAELQFISAEQYDAVVDPGHSPMLNGGSVHVGVDLGIKSDSSSIVAVAWQGKKLAVAFHQTWRPVKRKPMNLDDVKDYIREMTQRHAVQSILADPSQAYPLIQQLAGVGIGVTEFPQTQANGVKMGETLFSLVNDGNLIAYKSPELREHVLNATGRETQSGVRMVKGKSSRKINAAIALAMALVSAVGMPALDTSGIRLAGHERIMSSGDTPWDMGVASPPWA